MGSSGLVYGNRGEPGLRSTVLHPPDVELSYSDETLVIRGTVITIPSMSINSVDAAEVLELMSSLLLRVVRMVGETEEYFDLFVANLYGLSRWAFGVMGLYSLGLTLLATYLVVNLHNFYQGKKDANSQAKATIRLLILVPEIIGGVARVIGLIDPSGKQIITTIVVYLFACSLACFPSTTVDSISYYLAIAILLAIDFNRS